MDKIELDLNLPNHFELWDKLKVRASSPEDDEDILFAVDPDRPKSRIILSKCPYCSHANRSNMGTTAKYGIIDPMPILEIECRNCKGPYAVSYEIVAMPYKTQIIKKA